MSLLLHRAERADRLVSGLAGLLATPIADPCASELVLVPAQGTERWLSQRLSHHLGALRGDGVCAGVDLRSPRSLVAEVLGTGSADPWSADELVWPLLEVIDGSLDEPWARVLALHLGSGESGESADLRRGRRFAVAHRLARLFVFYAAQRPSMLRDWEANRDADGAGAAVPADLAWQPELWRRLVASRGLTGPVTRHDEVLARLRAEPGSVSLPERLSLFGHTRLPLTEIELLRALAEHRDVHLWLPHPSPALWQALAGVSGVVRRAEDETHLAAHHPLLASLGRDVRELQRALAGPEVGPGPTEEGDPLPAGSDLLTWLQEDVRANRGPGSTGRVWSETDRSVGVHACHGPARQVQVLREEVLGLLCDRPDLEPRDIVVMCPDIEAYAPLLVAAFGLGSVTEHEADTHPGHLLQVRLADRALTQTNPLLGVVRHVLDLAGGRAQASAVLDLLSADPVRRRFGFSDDDLQLITDWVRDAGVRWGFDAAHRQDFGLQRVVQNTWRFGLDRLLAGVAVSADAHAYFDRTLPLDGVGSSDIELAGRLAEAVDRLQQVTDRLTGVQPSGSWLAALADGVEGLTQVPHADEWQRAQVRRELSALADATGEVPLRLPDVRALLEERLAGRPTRANFRTGSLTICTMTPMRSVPHRVVCLLGLDDGAFPRAGLSDGDDVLARGPLTGERDPRSEDRQLLLDALMSATEQVVITYSGADEVTGLERPPAVPLQELIDVLQRTAQGVRIVERHPLQAYDARNLAADHPESFDHGALRAAQAAQGQSAKVPLRRDIALPRLAGEEIQLDALIRFFKAPVKEFLRQRLEIALPQEGDEVEDQIPVDVGGLVGWGAGDRMLRDLISGVPLQDALDTEWRRGMLPPGRMGWRTAKEIADRARPLADLVAASTQGQRPSAIDVDVPLADGRRLVGAVGQLYGDRVIQATYSSLDAKQVIEAWLTALVLGVARPGRGLSAGAIGRGAGRRPTARMVFAEQPDAAELLAAHVAIYDAGMCGPLPLPVKTAYRWAASRVERRPDGHVRKWAKEKWEGGRFEGEAAEPAHVWAFGADCSFADLLRLRPRPGEEYDGETSRLGALAMRTFAEALQRGVR